MSNSIIVLMGGACVGKDTTLNLLKQKYPNLQTCVSHTTRPPRTNEVEGREYFFIDNTEFEAMYNNGEFIETRTYQVASGLTWHYGMSEKEVTSRLEQGHIIMILDLQGLLELKEYYQNSEVDIHAFYINVDEDTRIQRYLKRDNITVGMVQEAIRRLKDDNIRFINAKEVVDYVIDNPPTSDMTAYTIANHLKNIGVNID